MNNPISTFQNTSGDFVNVYASADYAGEHVDVTSTDGETFTLEGTSTPSQRFQSYGAALEAFTALRVCRLARKFGTYKTAQ